MSISQFRAYEAPRSQCARTLHAAVWYVNMIFPFFIVSNWAIVISTGAASEALVEFPEGLTVQ
jgi:hypothetical protein